MATFTPTEQAYVEEAVAIARSLGRPFEAKEVFVSALRNGCELSPAFDPRFVKIAPRTWVLDEDPERLQRIYYNDFFAGLASYTRRCIDLASMHASTICESERYLPYTRRHNKRVLIKEHLQEQGWSVTDEQVEQISLNLVIR